MKKDFKIVVEEEMVKTWMAANLITTENRIKEMIKRSFEAHDARTKALIELYNPKPRESVGWVTIWTILLSVLFTFATVSIIALSPAIQHIFGL